jgi:hypothetical protein
VDEDLHRRIDSLVAEEHELRRSHPTGLSELDRIRLRALEEGLDRTWDLLRQRQARRDAGLDPSAATERGSDVVEGYLS